MPLIIKMQYPYYRPYNPDFKLHGNDIRRIQAQYGKGTGVGATNPPFTQPPITQPHITQSPITQSPPGNFHNLS